MEENQIYPSLHPHYLCKARPSVRLDGVIGSTYGYILIVKEDENLIQMYTNKNIISITKEEFFDNFIVIGEVPEMVGKPITMKFVDDCMATGFLENFYPKRSSAYKIAKHLNLELHPYIFIK